MRRFGKFNLLTAAAVGLATLAMGAKAEAGFTITLASVTPSGSEYIYNYTAQISTGDEIRTGDFFRIYDFYGYVPGSISAPAGWTGSTALTNPTPPPNVLVPLGDDPNVTNLIFTYTGTPIIAGPTTILNFIARSQYALGTPEKNYVGRNTQAGGPTAGQPVDVVGNVRVPAVPEPASLVSMGLGVIALGFVAARRKRSV
jgi:hypothetical protein